MKIISWNVNGIRAAIKKDFKSQMLALNADIIAVQEIKCDVHLSELDLEGYKLYMFPANKKGYSGVAIYSKIEPKQIFYGMGDERFDSEGRTLICDFVSFYLINSYSPNAQEELRRLDYKIEYNDYLENKMIELKNEKSVLLCGDLNVAHNEIDLTNPKSNIFNPGFSQEERDSFTKLLSKGFKDSYRELNPDTVKYSWWSYRAGARARNVGWRIDYFVVDDITMKDKVLSVDIHNDIMGSDHCPVSIEIKD